jgi:hypothetical protein
VRQEVVAHCKGGIYVEFPEKVHRNTR